MKKQVKKTVSGHFFRLKKLFLGTVFGQKAVFEHCFWSTKNGFLKKYQRSDPLGRQGVESLRGGGASTGYLIQTLILKFNFFRLKFRENSGPYKCYLICMKL